MFKNMFLNTSAIRYDAEGDHKSDVEKAREAIAKNTVVSKSNEAIKKEGEKESAEVIEEKEEGEEEEEEEEEEGKEEGEQETEEQKAAKAAKEAETEKEKRKQERIQKRIDKAVASQRQAEARVAVLEAQLKADPDKTLTEEEIQKRAEAIANEKFTAKEVAALQKEFDNACDTLQSAGNKLDKEFTPKVVAMAEELGPIPSRVIGILSDLENGAKVLKFMVDDIDEAEKIYDLKDKPEKLAIALVRLSDKIAAAEKPAPKKISQVPNPVDTPRGSRVKATEVTGNMKTEDYIRIRSEQIAERRKQRGY